MTGREISKKTKSLRCRAKRSQRKRNRRGVVRRVLEENRIVEDSCRRSSTSTRTSLDLQLKIFFVCPLTCWLYWPISTNPSFLFSAFFDPRPFYEVWG